MSYVCASQVDPVPSARITSAPTGMARNRRRRRASVQTAMPPARLPAPPVALLVPTSRAGRVASSPDTLPGVLARPRSCADAWIAGSPVDLAVNELLLPPSLLDRLEPEALEQRLTFIAEKVGDECRAKRLVTLSENSNRIGSDNVHVVRYIDHVDLIASRRGVRDIDDAGIRFSERHLR